MSHKSIALLLLAYNRIGVTQRCVSSVVKHTDPQHTIHILDNASTDNTGLWLLELAQRHPNVKVYLHRENLGVAGGRAFLLKKAKGDIVGFLDSDVDVFSSDWLTPIEQRLEDKTVGVVGQMGHRVYKDFGYQAYSPDYEGPCHILSGYSQFFRLKDFRQKHLEIDLQFNYGGAEDDDFCFQWLQKGYINYKIKLPIQHEFSNTWNGSLYPEHRRKLREKWENVRLPLADNLRSLDTMKAALWKK